MAYSLISYSVERFMMLFVIWVPSNKIGTGSPSRSVGALGIIRMIKDSTRYTQLQQDGQLGVLLSRVYTG